MGNCWTGVSDKKFLDSERSVLQLTGLDVDADIKIRNIEIDSIGNYVRTYDIITDSDKPTLVIMHGYGASAVIFWKIIKSLREDYNLILVDILGMGGSSRPKFTINNREEAEVYLVEWFEAWRLKYCQGGLTDFILAGHSFGGYISGLYALKYH
jgi:cardiolipin-specific phospholipase